MRLWRTSLPVSNAAPRGRCHQKEGKMSLHLQLLWSAQLYTRRIPANPERYGFGCKSTLAILGDFNAWAFEWGTQITNLGGRRGGHVICGTRAWYIPTWYNHKKIIQITHWLKASCDATMPAQLLVEQWKRNFTSRMFPGKEALSEV